MVMNFEIGFVFSAIDIELEREEFPSQQAITFDARNVVGRLA